ncbi:MAG TPA: S53 family peptidase [Actinocrinis sp.]|nr:S53 family peptidase [Actinocrinis sp.]
MSNPQTGRARTTHGARARALRIGIPLTTLAVIAAGSTQTAGAAVAPASHAPAAVGAFVPAPAGAVAAAAPDDSIRITVDVLLAPRNAAELAQYATAVSSPDSPFSKDYLSQGEAEKLFAPALSTVDAVDAALRGAGLTPGAAAGDDLAIPVTATLGQLKAAFGVGFAGYRLQGGRAAFGATSVPKVDGTVAADISGIVGLNDFAVPTANIANKGKAIPGALPATSAAKTAPSHSAPTMCSAFTDSINSYLESGEGIPAVDAGDYYSPSAISTAYGTAAQLAAGDNGSKVTVGVLEWEAVSPAALSVYQSCLGLNNKISYVNTDGGPVELPTADNGVGYESSLDIEDIASIAPGASIVDYQGLDADNPAFTDADWLDTFTRAVTDDKASVLSISWGECEAQTDTTTRSGETTDFELAAVQGQSVFVASGDDGSTDCEDADGNPLLGLAVDDPGVNPWVTDVGGTYMQGKTSPKISVWNDSTYVIGGVPGTAGGAGGGGVATDFQLSGFGDYQSGFKALGYADGCGAKYGAACRQVPDVTAIADWRAGFPQINYADSSGFYSLVDGGTSLAAPTMAGITALADASGSCRAYGAVGFANPALYDLARNPRTYANDFSDVKVGDNDYTTSGYTGGDYESTPGYDLASGLGSPKAATLIPSLCGR